MKDFSNQKGAISMMVIVGVLLTIVILVILGAYLFIKEKGDVVDEPVAIEDGNTTGQEEVKIEDGETQEFTYGFLNLENQRAPGKNVIYSPLSIKYLLNLLSDGANGNTKKEIDRLIKSENLTKYQNIDKVLSLANAVYIKDFAEIAKYIRDNVKNNDLVLTLGAGTVTEVGPKIVIE